MISEQRIGRTDELPPGSMRGAGTWAVANVDGRRHAVSRRCRHLCADLADGHIDENGYLVCPWHQSRYDLQSGQMVTGPQGTFARVPELGRCFTTLTRVLPLRRAQVFERDHQMFLRRQP